MRAFEIIGQVEAMANLYATHLHTRPTCIYIGSYQQETLLAAAYHLGVLTDIQGQPLKLLGMEIVQVPKRDHLDVGGDRLSVGELFQKVEP